MGRQSQFKTSPTKLMHTYDDFSGGMNLQQSDSAIGVTEFRLLQNVDLNDRGKVRKRKGYVSTYLDGVVQKPSSVVQGYAKFTFSTGNDAEFIFTNGQIFMKIGNNYDFLTPMAVYEQDKTTEDVNYQFQIDKEVEAIQHEDKFYLFSGTDLLIFEEDGAIPLYSGKWYKATPKTPNPNEYMRLGKNLLADDPENQIKGTAGNVNLGVLGIISDYPKGVVNTEITFNVVLELQTSYTPGDKYDLKLEYKKSSSDTWLTAVDWTEKTPVDGLVSETFSFEEEGNYDVRANVRETVTPSNTAGATLPAYPVKATDENEKGDKVHDLNTCRYVIEYYDKYLIYGGEESGNRVYISDLDDPTYFPDTHYVEFDTFVDTPINKLQKFQGILIAFTEESIFSLLGKSALNPEYFPQIQYEDVFRPQTVNTSIGCTSRQSVRAVQNYLFFQSYDGLYKLKAIWSNDDRYNVEPIDDNVRPYFLVNADNIGKGIAVYYDNQYIINFPNLKQSLRYYVQFDNWVLDKSDFLQWEYVTVDNGRLEFLSRHNNQIMRLSRKGEDHYLYDHSFLFQEQPIEVIVETPLFNQGYEFNTKKYKDMFLKFTNDEQATPLSVSVQVSTENSIILSTITRNHYINQDNESTYDIIDTPNVTKEGGTVFGTWEWGSSEWGSVSFSTFQVRLSGRGKGIKAIIKHKEIDEDFILDGFGYSFKLKKPKGER